MKKNLSFLQKLGFSAAALAMVGGLAWATGGFIHPAASTTKVWVVPEGQLTKDNVITFIGFDAAGRKQLTTDGTVADYDSKATNVAFKAVESTATTATNGIVRIKADGSDPAKYIKVNGTNIEVGSFEDKKESQWQTSYTDATHQYLTNQSNGMNMYYDSENHHFLTSVNTDAHFATYIQKEIGNTRISYNGEADKAYKEDADITYFRVGAGITASTITVSAPSAGDKVKTVIEYALTTSATAPASDADWTEVEATASAGAHSTTLSLSDAMFIAGTVQYLHTRLAVYDDFGNQISETDDEALKLERIDLDEPTIDATVTRDENNSYTVNVKATNTANIGVSDVSLDDVVLAPGTSTTYVQTLDGMTDGSVTLYAKTQDAAAIFTAEKTQSVTISPYYTESEAKDFFDITTDPGANTAVTAGQTIDIKCANASATKIFNITATTATPSVDDWTVKVDGSDTPIKVSAVTVSGTTYTVTVPTGVQADKGFTLNIPKDAWQGESETGKNVVKNNATTRVFNSRYEGKTFTITPGFNCISDDDYVNFDFNITGPTADKTCVLKYGDNTTTVTASAEIAKQVKVTEGDGVTEIPSTYWELTYTAGAAQPFNIKFTMKLVEGDYLITFPAGTLVDASMKYTNQYNTTAHIYVKEYVNFTFTLCDASGNDKNEFCENDPVYLKVTTLTATGKAPTFSYASVTDAASGSYFLANDHASEIGGSTPTFTGVIGSVSVIANDFESNYNKNIAASTTNTPTVYKHVVIASKAAVEEDVNAATVTFQIGAKHQSTDAAYLTSSEFPLTITGATVKINDKDATLYVDADGNATLTLPTGADKVPAGTYTVEYTYKSGVDGATTFGDPCEDSHKVSQSITLTTPVFSYTTASICSNKTSFVITPSVNIGTLAPLGVTCDVNEVNADGTALKAGVGTLTVATNTIALTDAPSVGTHYYQIAKDMYTNGISNNDGTEIITLEVTQHGDYKVVENNLNPVKVEHNSTATTVTFHMTVTPGTDPVISDMSKVALVDGHDVVNPTSVERQATSSIAGAYEFIATFEKAFVPNNYNISIAVDGVSATGVDNNESVLNIPIIVYKAVPTFAATDATKNQNIIAGSTAQDVALALTATDEEDVDRTNDILYASLTDWTVSYNDGTPVPVTVTGSKGAYNLNYVFKFAGKYVVSAKAGEFAVDASSNKEAIEWTINAETAASWKDGSAEGTSAQTEYTIPMSEFQTTTGLKLTDNGGSVEATYMEGTTPQSIAATYTVSDDKVVVTLANAFPNNPVGNYSDWTITLKQGVVKAGLSEMDKDCKIAVSISDEFVFNDATTKEADVNTAILGGASKQFNSFTFKRAKAATMQAISVPFAIPTDLVKDQFTILKIVSYSVVGTEACFRLETVTGSTKPNMPYILKPNADFTGASYEATWSNAIVYKPEAKSVKCTSTNDEYTFTSTVDVYNNVSNPDFYRLNKGVISPTQKPKAQGVSAWRWYMTSTNYLSPDEYVKTRIYIDGEEVDGEEATAINEVINSSVNDNEGIYTVSGQKLNKAQKGINIINGKKVLVK